MPRLGLQCGGFSSELAEHAGRPVLGWGSSNPDRGQAHTISDNYEAVLRRYMEALGARDYATIKSLFAEDGTDKVGALTLIYDTQPDPADSRQ